LVIIDRVRLQHTLSKRTGYQLKETLDRARQLVDKLELLV